MKKRSFRPCIVGLRAILFLFLGDRCWVLVKCFIPQFEDKQLVYSCLVYLLTLGVWGVGELLFAKESG
jgi:hypothetical protein